MRSKQIIIIPKDNKYKPRNMAWEDALDFFKVSNEELEKIIETGEEIRDAYIDEAVVYDNKVS